MTHQCEVIAEPQEGFLWRGWKFVAISPQGERIAESPVFRSGMFGLLHGKPEHRALEDLLYQLQVEGWQLGRHGKEWYALQLYRPEGVSVPTHAFRPTFDPSARRASGLSTQAMWGISLVVIVGLVLCLFLVCVVLALSTEFKVRPG